MALLQQLAKKGIIEKEKLLSLSLKIKQSGEKEEEVLLKSKLISEDDLFALKSQFFKIPLKEVIAEEIPLSVLELIPEETAKYYQMVTLSKKDNFLEIGMPYPEDLKAQEALKFLAQQNKFNYEIFLITLNTLDKLLKQYRTLKKEVTLALKELEKGLEIEETKVKSKTIAEFERIAEEAPITKIVAVILRHAVEGSASDIHIEPTREELRVRFRLLGILYSSIHLPLKVHLAVIARIKIISNLKIDESRIPQDGRFSVVIDERPIDFRVSIFPTALGEKAAIRVLDPEAKLKTFEELGLEGRNLEIIKTEITKPHGLILATGPTGSGKTTTLYTLLQLLNKESVNIVTLEDPIEYLIQGVNQSQIRPEIGYDFPVGLRYTLRQDPNILMIGEIRDEETANLVTHAALTGHIVLSTVHTNNAVGVIPRLIDLGIKSYLIPPSLSLVIAQRLVRKLCDNCKEGVEIDSKSKEIILRAVASFPAHIKKDLKIPEPLIIFDRSSRGCPKCGQSGFSTRIGVFEILLMTKQLSEIILKEPSQTKIIEEFERQEMITMYQDGILKVLTGLTTLEEVLMVTEEYVQ
jgi:type IV pilus assembly protein PilB